ncbi:unnamed protein product [Phytophthora lilii]|uniref:Unnamed protein product n=1 Tax=Phytophthora lilii TaxID=2077276 RepID=A0A9W7CJY0_9STRA|nr:unnamed protein product [Phytophthora lilii]
MFCTGMRGIRPMCPYYHRFTPINFYSELKTNAFYTCGHSSFWCTMRTMFTFEDDKELVQLAHSSSSGGSRISWSDIAQCMRRSGHPVSALKNRLQSHKRTWSSDISQFPRSFFTPVRRPRGRRPAVIRQLRAAPPPRAVPCPVRPGVRDVTVALAQRVHDPAVEEVAICDLITEASEQSARHDEPAGKAADASRPGVIGASTESSCIRAESCDVEPLGVGDEAVVQGASPLLSAEEEEVVVRESSSSPSYVADEVAGIFANVPRQLVVNDQNEPHHNVGELMPDGVNSLLDEIGPIDAQDLFLDIGAGVGNVVAHVALRTSDFKAIGIELREDICRAGVTMMMKI